MREGRHRGRFFLVEVWGGVHGGGPAGGGKKGASINGGGVSVSLMVCDRAAGRSGFGCVVGVWLWVVVSRWCGCGVFRLWDVLEGGGLGAGADFDAFLVVS